MFKSFICAALLLPIFGTAIAKDITFSQKRILNSGAVKSYRWIATAPSGVRFQLVQRIPDQTRSFYNDKGFPLKAADKYASACVMQTIFNNNTSNKVVTFNLKNWRVIHNKTVKPLPLTTEWMEEWKQLKVPDSARIAFRWSQFPISQQHRPGDWFQGMIATGLLPGKKFDLKISWTENNVKYTAIMKNIQCAADRNLGEKQ